MDIVRKIEETATHPGDRPKQDVVIVDCGELSVDVPFDTPKEAVEFQKQNSLQSCKSR